jgi:hypothetical protein
VVESGRVVKVRVWERVISFLSSMGWRRGELRRQKMQARRAS